MNPGEPAFKAGTPDHVGNVEHPAVVEHRVAIAHSGNPTNSLRNRLEILGLDSNQRRSFACAILAQKPPPDRRGSRDDVDHHEPDQTNQDITTKPGLYPKRYVSRFFAGDVGLVRTGHFQADVRVLSCPNQQPAPNLAGADRGSCTPSNGAER